MIELKVMEEGGRLDSYVASVTDLSRSQVKKLLDIGNILVNGVSKASSYKVKCDDIINITLEEKPDYLEPLALPLDIVYEDNYLLIINKPSGLVTHPAPGHINDTLVNALIYHAKIDNDDELRPGIVHRLDKDTSGLMLVAKNSKVHELLSAMIKNKEVERCYVALCDGVINHDSFTVDAPIGRDSLDRKKMAVTAKNSKEAITDFKVLKKYSNNTLLECRLRTGRTHQIRVHLNYIKHPVTNDPLYGNHKKTTDFGQFLHSKSIKFIHPITKEKIYFECSLPREFSDYLESLS